MSCHDGVFEHSVKRDEKMDVIGSQINLTSRSDQFPYASPCLRLSRPRSGALSFKSQNNSLVECSRPKSAEFFNINPHHHSPFQHSSNCNENKVNGDSSLSLSYFTDSSSKLLLHLLKESDKKIVNDRKLFLGNTPKDFVNIEANYPQVKQSIAEVHIHNSLATDSQNNVSKEMLLKNNWVTERKKDNSEILVMDSDATKCLNERLITFSKSEGKEKPKDFGHTERCPQPCSLQGRKEFHIVGEHETNLGFQKSQDCRRHFEKTLSLDEEKSYALRKVDNIGQDIPKIEISESENEEEVLKIGNSNESFQNEKESLHIREGINENDSSNERTLKNDYTSKSVSESSIFNFIQQPVSVTDILTSKSKIPEKCDVMDRSFNIPSFESPQISDQENSSKFVCLQGSDSTYDEIIQLLQTLEDENVESHIHEKRPNSEESNSLAEEVFKDTIGNLNEVFAYLEEVEKDDTFYRSAKKESSKDFTSPSLEKLLNKTSVELAHEVLSLEIQIEDQKKGIKLLKDTLADMKESKRIAECEHQEILQKTSSEAEALVKRHQKFIKQLLNEKKNLSETVSKLVNDLKTSEEKHKINIKAMEEKHLIEVKKAKDVQAVADKIKREKWMEMKTQKIKEMTVKGLEPELSRMAAQQQQEVTELRNLHRAEIEAIELKAARRTSELMDQLRTELTKEKESAITDKLNSLRASMEREFEDERNKFHQNCQSLKQRIRKLEEKLSSQDAEFHLGLMESKQEMEREKQKLIRIHQENLDDVKRRHSMELNNLRETLEAEKQVCLKNQEKQLAAKFLDKEAELHEQYRRERDREIEMVIENLEKEQAKIQAELGTAGENKLKRVREKFEAEIKELEANADDLKSKLSIAKSEVSEKEECVTQLNSQIRQLQTEISFLRKSCENMISERTQLKETIRSEFESSINELVKENKNLQKEILDLRESHLKDLSKKDQLNLQAKNEMQKELTNVYSRIKAAIGKKEKIIEALREENKATNERYRQLELMLDKQRRNLLLQ